MKIWAVYTESGAPGQAVYVPSKRGRGGDVPGSDYRARAEDDKSSSFTIATAHGQCTLDMRQVVVDERCIFLA
jgi:hypothetical protein